MRHVLPISILLAVALSAATAQVASHSATSSQISPAQVAAPQVSDQPVARVNGTVLTDRDLLREMYAIFPYAQQHNGFL